MTRSRNPREVLANHKVLDSPLTSAEGLRSEGWGSGLRVSGVGHRVWGGLRDEGLGLRVEGLGFEV